MWVTYPILGNEQLYDIIHDKLNSLYGLSKFFSRVHAIAGGLSINSNCSQRGLAHTDRTICRSLLSGKDNFNHVLGNLNDLLLLNKLPVEIKPCWNINGHNSSWKNGTFNVGCVELDFQTVEKIYLDELKRR